MTENEWHVSLYVSDKLGVKEAGHVHTMRCFAPMKPVVFLVWHKASFGMYLLQRVDGENRTLKAMRGLSLWNEQISSEGSVSVVKRQK
jgi:hypothetical protein